MASQSLGSFAVNSLSSFGGAGVLEVVEDYRSDTFRFFSELPCERRPLTFPPPAERDSDRSEHWKRSNPSLAQSAKAVPPSSFPASEDPQPSYRQRSGTRAEASIGSDLTLP
jgi:hypothetical protein